MSSLARRHGADGMRRGARVGGGAQDIDGVLGSKLATWYRADLWSGTGGLINRASPGYVDLPQVGTPTLTTDGGRAAISCTAGSRFQVATLATDLPTSGAYFTTWTVFRRTTSAIFTVAHDMRVAGGQSVARLQLQVGATLQSTAQGQSTLSIADAITAHAIVRTSFTSTARTLAINGVVGSTLAATTGYGDTDYYQLGSAGTPDPQLFRENLLAIGALSAGEIAAVEAVLSARWGIAI